MDTLGPLTELKIMRQGQVLSDGDDLVPFIEDLTVDLADWGLSELTIELNDEGHKLRDSNLLMLGDVVVVTLGWPDHSKIIDAFEVVERRTQFGGEGMLPSLYVRGLPGPNVLMSVQGKVKGGSSIQDPLTDGKADRGGVIWGTEKQKTKPSSIVKDVIRKYPFQVDIAKSAKAKEPEVLIVQPRDVSDWDLLQKLAKFLGLTMYWRWNDQRGTWVLYWGKNPGDFQQRQYTFEYDATDNTTIFGVDIEQVKIGQSSQVEILVWDADDKVWKMVWVGSNGGGQAYTKDGAVKDNTVLQIRTSGFAIRTMVNQPFSSVDEAMATATAVMEAQKRHFWRCSVETIGMEGLRPFQKHTLSGLGAEFDGDYRLTGVRHHFNRSGFWTEFEGYKILETKYQTVKKRVAV